VFLKAEIIQMRTFIIGLLHVSPRVIFQRVGHFFKNTSQSDHKRGIIALPQNAFDYLKKNVLFSNLVKTSKGE